MVNDMLLFSIGAVGRLVRKLGDRHVKAVGLTSAQFQVMFLLNESGEICQHDIENEFSLSRAAVSGLLDSMENAGLIRRVVSDNDRRLRIIEITPEGKSKLEMARKMAMDAEKAIDEVFSPEERRNMVEMLGRIREVLEEKIC